MKTQLVRIIALSLALVASVGCFGVDYYKEISTRFKVNSNVKMNLATSFSSITVNTWDESEIYIMVKINVDVKNESKAEQIFRSVEIDENAASPRLNISPSFKSRGNENFNIQVEIKMPRSASISGDVDFGNLTLSSITGTLDVDLNYGNLTAAELKSSSNDVSVSFGNATVAMFGGGKVNVDYGNLKLEQLSGNTTAQIDFGNVRIIKVSPSVTYVKANCQYGNIDMSVRTNSLVIAESSYGDIDFHGTYKMNSKEKDDFTKRYEAQTGDGKCKVELEAGFGNIDVAFD